MSDKQATTAMTRELILKIKKAYAQAKADSRTSFTVGAMEFDITYAGYFLQQYAPKFGVQFDH